MKKVLFLSMFAAFTLASCGGDSTERTTEETQVLTDTSTVVEEREVEIERTTEVDIDTSDAEVVDTLNQNRVQ